MTSTAFDDQFTTAPEPVRQPYDTVAILRRNIAEAEKEMQRQAERAESYAETLRSLASYVGSGGYSADTVDAGVFEEKIRWGIGEIMTRAEAAEAEIAKTQATLAKAREQTPVGWIDADGYFYHGRHYPNVWPTAVPVYAAPVPAPAVPEDQFRGVTKLVVPDDWRNVMKELADDAEQSLLIQYSDKERYPSLMLKFNNDMELVNRARALLQSAPQSEVRHD